MAKTKPEPSTQTALQHDIPRAVGLDELLGPMVAGASPTAAVTDMVVFDDGNPFNAVEPMEDFDAPIQLQTNAERDNPNQDEVDDFVLVRRLNHSLLERGQIALEHGMKEVKASGGHPRSLEVVNRLIEGLSAVSKDLLELHSRNKEIRNPGKTPAKASGGGGDNNIQNAVIFQGTPQEIAAMRKNASKASEKVIEGTFTDARTETA